MIQHELARALLSAAWWVLDPAAKLRAWPVLYYARLVRDARSLGALGATISGAGPSVLLWSHYEHTGALVQALQREARGWASVIRAPFEAHGADVREL